MKVNRFYAAVGGRKAASGLIAAALLTTMAFPLSADFQTYMTGVLIALGLTQASVAYEDTKKRGSSEA